MQAHLAASRGQVDATMPRPNGRGIVFISGFSGPQTS
jgi:hypothetical protein